MRAGLRVIARSMVGGLVIANQHVATVPLHRLD